MSVAVIYCRQSDAYGGAKSEGDDALSIEAQLDACRAHAARLGLTIAAEYTEQFSGLNDQRPQYLRMLREIRTNVRTHKKGDPARITHLVIYKWSRLSRNPDEIVPQVGIIGHMGVEVEPAADQKIGNSQLQKFMLYAISTFNNIQVTDAIEFSSNARRTLWNNGKLVCNGKARYGYRYDKATRTRVIDEDQARVVRRIFAWFLEGHSAHKVMTLLRDEGTLSPSGRPRWGLKSIRDIIKDASYKGAPMRVQKTERIPIGEGGGYHPCNSRKARKAEGREIGPPSPAIVSVEVWDKANELVKGRYRESVRANDDWLVGRVWCSKCGVRLAKFKHARGYSYWRCPRHQNFKECSNRLGHALDKYIREEAERNLARIMNDDRLLDAKIREWEATIADPCFKEELDRNLAETEKLRTKAKRLLAKFGDDADDDDLIADQLQIIKDQIKAKESQAASLSAKVAQVKNAQETGRQLRACLLAFNHEPYVDAIFASEHVGVFVQLMPQEDQVFLADAAGIRVEVGRPDDAGSGITVTTKIFDFESVRAYSKEPSRGRSRGSRAAPSRLRARRGFPAGPAA